MANDNDVLTKKQLHEHAQNFHMAAQAQSLDAFFAAAAALVSDFLTAIAKQTKE